METGMRIGYGRTSTAEQRYGLEAQRRALMELGCEPDRIYLDHGTGRSADRPGLREALAACREGDVLTVIRLDRLGRSVSDLANITNDLTNRGVSLRVGSTLYDASEPVSRMILGMLSVVAQFEADLIRARTREGLAIAKANGRLKGGKPKLTPAQEKHLVDLVESGEHTIAMIADIMGVGRGTVYRALERAGRTTGERSAAAG